MGISRAGRSDFANKKAPRKGLCVDGMRGFAGRFTANAFFLNEHPGFDHTKASLPTQPGEVIMCFSIKAIIFLLMDKYAIMLLRDKPLSDWIRPAGTISPVRDRLEPGVSGKKGYCPLQVGRQCFKSLRQSPLAP